MLFFDAWFLTGPTASGKSAVGVELARRIGAEIVSMDSMALYRGMDIGTAKPTAEQRRAVSHHLVVVLEPCEEYSLAQYIEAAGRCVNEVSDRGNKVLFVGGTPLYLKGLLRGIFEGPPADETLRRQLREKGQQHGSTWLHDQVKEVDPAAAAKLHPNDTKRLVRALEVFHKSGTPISELQRQFGYGRPAETCRVFVLEWSRPELHRRIERRVEEMFQQGLVEEVRRLLKSDSTVDLSRSEKNNVEQTNRNVSFLLSKTARQAVGYTEVIEHLEGRADLADTIAAVKLHTRQLAKRQTTWFRSLSECRFVPASGKTPAELAEEIQNAGSRIR